MVLVSKFDFFFFFTNEEGYSNHLLYIDSKLSVPISICKTVKVSFACQPLV